MDSIYWFMLGLGIGYLFRQLENIIDLMHKEQE